MREGHNCQCPIFHIGEAVRKSGTVMRARVVLCYLELRQPLLELALSIDGTREQCDPPRADSLCAVLCTECQLRVLRVEHSSA